MYSSEFNSKSKLVLSKSLNFSDKKIILYEIFVKEVNLLSESYSKFSFSFEFIKHEKNNTEIKIKIVSNLSNLTY